MKLFTREEKKEPRLLELYEEEIKKCKRPNKAAKLAREAFQKENG